MEDKQKRILEINKDTTLSQQEKQKKIHEIMIENTQIHIKPKIKECLHYKKQCSNFHFVCCNKYYNCCRCHNEDDECKEKIIIDKITCNKCGLEQLPNDKCEKCDFKFSRSYCGICNIWSEKNIYHCENCGICRVGDKQNFFHCLNCGMCFKNEMKDSHTCVTKINHDDKCGFCLGNVFNSQEHTISLKCGHKVHKLCLTNINDYRCPMCRKSMYDMTKTWEMMDMSLQQYVVPPDLQKKVDILCYDCQNVSSNVDWHFMAIKCKTCRGYNTSVN